MSEPNVQRRPSLDLASPPPPGDVGVISESVEHEKARMRLGHVVAGEPDDPPRPRVDADTLVERDDLGAGVTTFVAAGEPVPVGLEDYPRRSADPKPKAGKRGKRKR